MECASLIEQRSQMRTSVRTQSLFEVVNLYEVNNRLAPPVPPFNVPPFQCNANPSTYRTLDEMKTYIHGREGNLISWKVLKFWVWVKRCWFCLYGWYSELFLHIVTVFSLSALKIIYNFATMQLSLYYSKVWVDTWFWLAVGCQLTPDTLTPMKLLIWFQWDSSDTASNLHHWSVHRPLNTTAAGGRLFSVPELQRSPQIPSVTQLAASDCSWQYTWPIIRLWQGRLASLVGTTHCQIKFTICELYTVLLTLSLTSIAC